MHRSDRQALWTVRHRLCSWLRAPGACRSEVKEEVTAQPGPGDMSSGEPPVPSARSVSAAPRFRSVAAMPSARSVSTAPLTRIRSH